MKLIIIGVGGKMGKTLVNCINSNGKDEILCGIDAYCEKDAFPFSVYQSTALIPTDLKPDVIIDFSVREAIYDFLPYAIKTKTPCVIATTGHTQEQSNYIFECADKIPVFKTGNMSVGINLLLRLAKIGAATLGESADIEIVETHHNQKVDAPSGTALLLANGIKEALPTDPDFVYGRSGHVGKRGKEIGIHAVRGGTVVGKHEISFFLNNEIITLKHEAESKSVFAYGALDAAAYLISKPAGLYDMQDLLS
ncbi:MAG: 4-hydroxy-tetrahydrodipicolinate reductase [Clostridia bacterium]|nr:4-hydroxy-tetrahydrodipicolinate reductase [Clostridia bacterium]